MFRMISQNEAQKTLISKIFISDQTGNQTGRYYFSIVKSGLILFLFRANLREIYHVISKIEHNKSTN